MSLYPTKTRLALLADVAEGRVWHYPAGVDYVRMGPSRRDRRVTARMAEFSIAQWVRLPVYFIGPVRWELTDAGRAVLEGGES